MDITNINWIDSNTKLFTMLDKAKIEKRIFIVGDRGIFLLEYHEHIHKEKIKCI